ncbi:MAG: hypothetical protein ACFFH0_12745 [Promethearchaeota archaeon]
MQVEFQIHEVAQLYLGIAAIVAAGTVIWYSRRRSAEQEPGIRAAFRPLYLYALALLFYAISTFVTYYEVSNETSFILEYMGYNPSLQGWQSLIPYYTQYLFLLVEIVILGIAASMITRQAYIAVFATIVAGVCFWFFYNSAIIVAGGARASYVADVWFNLGSLIRSFMMAGVAAVFVWIAVDARRGPAVAMAFALVVQLFNIPLLYTGLRSLPGLYEGLALPYPVTVALLFVALMGPAMIAFAFLRPEAGATYELMGYGASFAGPILILSAVQLQGLLADIQLTLTAGLGSLAIALAAGTAAYLIGRWRESRQTPTLLLMAAFAFLAISQTVGILGNLGNLPTNESQYFELLLVGLSLAIFSVTGIFAAGYRSAGLLPLLLYVPLAIFIVQQYPARIEDAFLNLLWLVAPLLILFFLPVILFSGVWWRMRSTDLPGRMRPLGLALGILLYIAIRVPILLVQIPGVDPGYALVTVSFLASWLAVTGRLDRYAGTASPP